MQTIQQQQQKKKKIIQTSDDKLSFSLGPIYNSTY